MHKCINTFIPAFHACLYLVYKCSALPFTFYENNKNSFLLFPRLSKNENSTNRFQAQNAAMKWPISEKSKTSGISRHIPTDMTAAFCS